MTPLHITLLADRGVVSVTGGDARKLLQGLITNDMDTLRKPGDAIHAGLLTPQGKILFAFFVVQTGDGFLLETESDQVPALVKRLTFYKLRAAVKIEDTSDRLAVAVAWGVPGSAEPTSQLPGSDQENAAIAAFFQDPRHTGLGWRLIASKGAPPVETAALPEYHAHRIALGVPEPQLDYPLGDTYPHEADYDAFHGADFEKGCFVGQEVVARMQHKTVVRKRVVRVEAASELPATNPDVTMGSVAIGRLGSVAGKCGLALIRLDRAIEAIDKGEAIMTGGIALTIDAGAISAYRARAASKAGAL